MSIVYGVVAVPYEEDCDCDKLSQADILFAEKSFMNDYRRIDKDHCLAFGSCPSAGEVIDSIILSNEEVFKTLGGQEISVPEGSWVLGIDVKDQDILAGINNGKYSGFSLMATSNVNKSRTTLADLGDDFVVTAVSIVEEPCIPKARFIEFKEELKTMSEDKIISEESVKSTEVQEASCPCEGADNASKGLIKSLEKEFSEEEQEEIEFASKSDVEELKSIIEELKADIESEAVKSIEEAKDAEIAALKSEIEELKEELKTVGKSKAISEEIVEKSTPLFGEFEDRDSLGRKI